MKKSFIASIVSILFVVTLIIGCSKTMRTVELKDPSKLNEDKAFVELSIETYEYLSFISDKMKENSVSLTLLQSQLSILQSKNLPFNEQMSSIDVLFKTSVSQRLEVHMLMYKANWDNIKARYKTITKETLEKECTEVISTKLAKRTSSKNISAKEAVIEDCGWRYYVCAGAATAGAVLCHAGCDTTALATTAGLGIPACVAACGALQAFALVQCADSYCPTSSTVN